MEITKAQMLEMYKKGLLYEVINTGTQIYAKCVYSDGFPYDEEEVHCNI